MKGSKKGFWSWGLPSFSLASMSFARPIAREIDIGLWITISFLIYSDKLEIKQLRITSWDNNLIS